MNVRVWSTARWTVRFALVVAILGVGSPAAYAQSPPVLVQDIVAGPDGSFPEVLTNSGGEVYFRTSVVAVRGH